MFHQEMNDKSRFAEQMISTLRGLGKTGTIEFDSDNCRLVFGDELPRQFNLEKAWFEAQNLSTQELQAHLEHYAMACRSLESTSMPATPEECLRRVRPVIISRAQAQRGIWHGQLDGVPQLFGLPWASHLTINLVQDFERTMRFLGTEEVSTWNIPAEKALTAAKDNLRAIGGEFVRHSSGLYISPWQDSYDCARLLLPEMFESLKVRGDVIAMAADRCQLLVAGSKDHSALRCMVALARKSFDHPRFISGIPLRLVDGHWETYQPKSTSAASPELRELRVATLAGEYRMQVKPLYQLENRTVAPAYVSTYMFMNSTTGPKSVCTWTNGISQLLPVTERVGFVDASNPRETIVYGDAAWGRVREVLGHLMTQESMYPVRFRVKGFPTRNDLRRMGITNEPIRTFPSDDEEYKLRQHVAERIEKLSA